MKKIGSVKRDRGGSEKIDLHDLPCGRGLEEPLELDEF